MSLPTARRIVPLASAKPGDLVDLADRGIARLVGIAPNGDLFLHAEGYPRDKGLFTIHPGVPPGTFILDPSLPEPPP